MFTASHKLLIFVGICLVTLGCIGQRQIPCQDAKMNVPNEHVVVAGTVTTPIIIDGNKNLSLFTGISGAGTESNPYEIRDLVANLSWFNIILTVRNTNAFLQITNCKFIGFEGLNLFNVSNINVVNCTFTGYEILALYNVSNVKVMNCHLNALFPVYGIKCQNLTIANSTFGNKSTDCITLAISSNVIIANNTYTGAPTSLQTLCYFDSTANVTLQHNVGMTSSALLRGNMPNSNILGYTVSPDNLIDGKPVAFLKSQVNASFSGIASQIFAVNCTNCTFKNVVFVNSSMSMTVYMCRYLLLDNATFTNDAGLPVQDITIDLSNGMTIKNCTFMQNVTSLDYTADIALSNVNDARVVNCTFTTTNVTGIKAFACKNLSVTNSTFSSTRDCVDISYTANVTIANNSCINGKIYFCDPSNMVTNLTLQNNKVTGNRAILPDCAIFSGYHVYPDNTLNGKPLVFIYDDKNVAVTSPACQVFVINSTNISVSSISISNTTYPLIIRNDHDVLVENFTYFSQTYYADCITVGNSNNVTFKSCNFSGSVIGVTLYLDNDLLCQIVNCSFTAACYHAIEIDRCKNVTIVGYTFVNTAIAITLGQVSRITILNNTCFNATAYFCLITWLVASLTMHNNHVMLTPLILGFYWPDDNFSSYTITPDNTLNGIPLIFVRNASNLVLSGPACQVLVVNTRNVTLQGISFTNASIPITIYKGNQVTIKDMAFNNTKDYSIFLQNSSSITIADITFTRASTVTGAPSINSQFCSGLIVKNCKFLNRNHALFYGIYCYGTSNLLVDGCESANAGISVSARYLFYSSTFQTVTNITIANSIFSGIGDAITVSAAETCTIISNQFNNVLGSAIHLEQTQHDVIKDNTFVNCTQDGIYLFNSYHDSITANAFTNMSHNCVECKNSGNGLISGNSFSGATTHVTGITLMTTVSLEILSNTFDTLNASVILQMAFSTLIEENNITSSNYGIVFQNTNCTRVTNCNFRSITVFGIAFYNSSYNTVEECQFTNVVSCFYQDPSSIQNTFENIVGCGSIPSNPEPYNPEPNYIYYSVGIGLIAGAISIGIAFLYITRKKRHGLIRKS